MKGDTHLLIGIHIPERRKKKGSFHTEDCFGYSCEHLGKSATCAVRDGGGKRRKCKGLGYDSNPRRTNDILVGGLGQLSLNFNMYQNPLEGFLKHRLRSSSSRVSDSVDVGGA